MARRRRHRRNPGGALEWAKAHPWMTFFLVSSALAIPLTIAQVLVVRRAVALDSPPSPRRLPGSTAPITLDDGTVFVPGVLDTQV